VVQTGDVVQLADTLSVIARLPTITSARMREACLERAHFYSIEHLVERYTTFYQALLLDAPAPEAVLPTRVAGR
jgi:hypothetical protein